MILNPVGEIVKVTRSLLLKAPSFLFAQLNREKKDGGRAAFHFEEESSLFILEEPVMAGRVDEFFHRGSEQAGVE